ncbi:MAG TPA: MBL fold metallo-hydrolase [Candidatus Acidoferrales bacterium]|nr:MBL fold metallo-hydrolase [Candidatus Acidoferrales bacterium]
MPERLIHEVLPVGLLQCNCSILGDRTTSDAIVVDPGDEVDRILEIIAHHKLKITAIVSTHTHIDHVGGLAALHRATRAPVLIHDADLGLYRNLHMQAQWLGVPTPETVLIRDFVKEGDVLPWGGFLAHVLHTPGHTPGSISLVIEDRGDTQQAHHARGRRLIAGDTLFQGSIGRTDLPGGSYPQIIRSIHDKLLTLSDDIVVYPGHGEATTIGSEREHNPFLR